MDIISKIVERSDKSEEEVWLMIENKRKELDYLISEEGAAHIVASELGVSLKQGQRVEDLEEGAFDGDLHVRILNAFDIREFERKGKTGKVRNLVVADETGNIRLSLWDEKAELDLKSGDFLKLSSVYLKKTDRGLEIRAGNKSGAIVNPENTPDRIKNLRRQGGAESLKDAKDGDTVRIKAMITTVFNRFPFFESAEGRQLMVSAMVDDGTASLRTVFFRNAAEALIGMTREEAIEIADSSGYGALLAKVPKLMQMRFYGRVKNNEMTDSKELIVNRVFPMKVEEEVDKRLEKIMGV